MTDGVFRAYVEDVVLTPDARGAGIGQLLVERLLQLTPPAAVTTPFCSPQLTGFYARSGFRASTQIVMHRHPSP